MKTLISKLVDAAVIVVSAVIGGVMPVVALSILLSARAGAQLDVSKVGDVFVAINNGKYQILRVTGSGSNASFQVVDTLNDSTGNTTAGCAFTPTFRPITTSFAAGVAPSLVERYRISNIGTTHTVVVSTDTSANGGFSGKSVALDAQSSIYVGHSGGTGEIDQYIQPGPRATKPGTSNFLTFTAGTKFLLNGNVDVAGSEWLDVTSVANGTPNGNGLPASAYIGYSNDLYYTSGGLNIYLLAFVTSPSNSPLPPATTPSKLSINLLNFNPPNSFAYHGIKILADASGNPTGLIVAGGAKIVQFTLTSVSTAVLTTVYDNKGGAAPNWQSVSLDTAGTGFWATDQANSKLAHFTIVTGGNPSKFITATPDTTLSLSATPSGVCVNGSFSPGQPKRRQPTPATVTLTTASPINTFSIPIVYPNFYAPNQTSQNTFTTGATFTPQTNSAQATLYFVDFDPTNNEGVSDDQIGSSGKYGNACLTTAPPPPLGVVSPYCEAYKLEMTPPIGQGYSLDLDLFVLQQTTSPLNTPPSTPGPQPVGTNAKFYHDVSADETDAILQDETRIKNGTGSTDFTIQNESATVAVSCGYQTPVAPLSTTPPFPTFNHGRTIDFKFLAAALQGTAPNQTIDCQHGPFVSAPDLKPFITLVQLNPNKPASSTQVADVHTAGCSNQCGGSAFFNPPVGNGSTWELQVKSDNLTSGTYIATTIDQNGNMPEFSSYICIDFCTSIQ